MTGPKQALPGTRGLLARVLADDKTAIATGTWVEYNVTLLIAGDGTYSFAFVPTSTDSVSFSVREGNPPPGCAL